eukprot:5626901-Prymnesium_polylepis.2
MSAPRCLGLGPSRTTTISQGVAHHTHAHGPGPRTVAAPVCGPGTVARTISNSSIGSANNVPRPTIGADGTAAS